MAKFEAGTVSSYENIPNNRGGGGRRSPFLEDLRNLTPGQCQIFVARNDDNTLMTGEDLVQEIQRRQSSASGAASRGSLDHSYSLRTVNEQGTPLNEGEFAVFCTQRRTRQTSED